MYEAREGEERSDLAMKGEKEGSGSKKERKKEAGGQGYKCPSKQKKRLGGWSKRHKKRLFFFFYFIDHIIQHNRVSKEMGVHISKIKTNWVRMACPSMCRCPSLSSPRNMMAIIHLSLSLNSMLSSVHVEEHTPLSLLSQWFVRACYVSLSVCVFVWVYDRTGQ